MLIILSIHRVAWYSRVGRKFHLYVTATVTNVLNYRCISVIVLSCWFITVVILSCRRLSDCSWGLHGLSHYLHDTYV